MWNDANAEKNYSVFCFAYIAYAYVVKTELFFSTSHVIPHIRALAPCPGLTSEVGVVASTSVPLTPTEILNLVFL